MTERRRSGPIEPPVPPAAEPDPGFTTAELASDVVAAAAATEARRRGGSTFAAFGPGGRFRRFAKLWGFLGFCILVLFLARAVILPFIFALLLAYILAPVVRRMSRAPSGKPRMPRGVAILSCYVVLLAAIGLFVTALLPRIAKDVTKLGKETPGLYKRLNDEVVPNLAAWLETRFPALRPPDSDREPPPVVADVPVPPGTQFMVTPLPDGRLAIQLSPTGVQIAKGAGGWVVSPRTEAPTALRLEDRLRNMAGSALGGLQGQLGDVFRIGQVLVTGVIKSIFTFFLVLMIAGFILLDLEKLHGFARGLIPAVYRTDYDVIVAGIDRGLSGVIRGQLLICLVNGVLTYVGLVIFDVKYALVLAVVACVLSLIPIFGSILSSIPIVLSALVSSDAGIDVARAIIVLAWIVGIHFIEANLLNPKIIGSAAKIHPVLVIFSLIVGEHSYGLTGALLAVPVASIIQVLFVYFRSKTWRTETTTALPTG
jgi:predicted PurR-regulated permease PerM